MSATETKTQQQQQEEGETETVVVTEDDDEHDSKERVLQKHFLQEWSLLKSLLHDIVSSSSVSNPSSIHQIRSIMDKYQEQGHLLEPYLDTIVTPLMRIIRDKTAEIRVVSDDGGSVLETTIKPICIVIYTLLTVCGYKSVIKFFPHHVSDLELAVLLLEQCHQAESGSSLRQESKGDMEAKCVVLLWLSILVLVPFDIATVDSGVSDSGSGIPPLVLRVLGFCKDYLSSAGPMRTMAGLLLSKLLTRPDMSLAFKSYIDWTHEVLSNGEDDLLSHFRLLGAVEALAAIFKVGRREVLIDVVPIVWGDATSLSKSGAASRSPLLRKFLVKLTQRIGLICLPHRLPAWRYVGKTSSLGDNVSLGASRQTDLSMQVDSKSCKFKESAIQEDEDMDVPEIIEVIIEMLLLGLRDTDTVVRWSAAKGIGRITSRLTSALSEEVLSSVLELFSPGEGDGSWHGACLALAELARRGLLLPRSLPNVVTFVTKALHYDVRRGPHSVGSHVRDAAAYVCWAFGRAYYHDDMKSVLEQIAPHLLTVSCYDREVNCRRAAAAAFQENVGRQGKYPHGIDIVNTADYFSLSSRVNSYLHVAVGIAQFEGYLYPFAEELLYNKISHWDKALRELASQALASLVKYDPQYFAIVVLDKLVPSTLSTDLSTRHGTTLATGEVVLALHELVYALPADRQKLVAGIVPAIEKARLYRGKGGEIMRAAVSRFIECISLSHLPISEKIKKSLLDTLNENLRHPNAQIQNAAIKALKPFVREYLVSANNGGGDALASKYLGQLTDQNAAVRRGSALALGALPYELLANRWRDVLLKLCKSCLIEDNPEDRDAEARVNAVRGLISVCETLNQAREISDNLPGENDSSLYHVIVKEVVESLFKALDDYSVDNRGDVGSWVREAAMEGLEKCTYILCMKNSSRKPQNLQSLDIPNGDMTETNHSLTFFDANLATNVIGGLVKQAVEKMDKLREAAIKTVQRILYNTAIFIPFIEHRKKLEEIVPDEEDLKWAAPAFSYPRLVQLLQFSCYSKAVLSGLVIAIGGLQDSLRKISILALLEYLEETASEASTERMSREYLLCNDVLWVLQQYKGCERVIVPTLKMIEILFSHKIFLNMEAHTAIFCSGVLDSLKVELRGSKDFSKLYAGIAILGYIASVSDLINTRAFTHLLAFLVHRYPKIRKAAAEHVYLVLLQNGNLVPEEKTEQALEIISETCWDGDIGVAKQKRLEFCELAGLELAKLPEPRASNKESTQRQPTANDENASYASLVGSSRF